MQATQINTQFEDETLEFINNLPTPPNVGDLVEGPIVAMGKAAVYIDLYPFGTGIIMGREYIIARDLIRKVHVGDIVSAKVSDLKNEDGYIELSLKEAKQAIIWNEVEEAIKNKTTIELAVQDANKGGLLMTWQGLQGFLPASQLKPENYPRVMDGDKVKILEELNKLVGQKLSVIVIGATSNDGKLVFSEKGSSDISNISEQRTSENTEGGKYSVNDTLEGEVTGVVDFGIFVKIDQNTEGLVHISEIDWSLVENPRTHVNVGDKIKVKVIEIKDGKVSLSIKALKENPWVAAKDKYKKDMVVKGIVIKHNKHGALASIEEGVAGLIHISEFKDSADLREKLELGKVYDFKITLFETKGQKMTLSTSIN